MRAAHFTRSAGTGMPHNPLPRHTHTHKHTGIFNNCSRLCKTSHHYTRGTYFVNQEQAVLSLAVLGSTSPAAQRAHHVP